MLARRNRNNPLEFRKKLVLNQWLINLFGVNPLSEANHNELPFHRLSAPIRSVDPEGLDTDGLHRFYHALVNSELFYNNSSSLTREQLLSYEENIARHTLFINRRRNRPIVWKYFQWLSLLFVEIYLDRYFTNREGLLNDLNSFIMQFNEHWVGYENVNPYTDDDLNKICMQNATGSGKTLIMHVNLLQFRHYAKKTKLGRDISHVILITPNEGLTEQHLEELNQSGFGLAQRLKSGQEGSLEQIDVLEITKLGDKSGPNTKATRDLGDQNLLLVDEGHRGMSGTEEGAFFTRRAQLCGRGFTFEYSATFEQAVAASSSQVLAESYAKAILFDYSYRWFYEDGFGKDYQILNLPRSLEEVQDIYLTACLLKFYQQLLLFKDKRKELELFNLEKPLWVFVGSTVTKKKGNQQILVPTADLITDVGKVIKFIADFLSRPQVFQRYINQLMNGTGADTGLLDGSGNDIFHSSFQYLKIYYIAQSDPAAIYAHILLHLFNNSGGGHLSLTRIKGESGEIALYAGNSDSSFGLINVGDSKGLCEHIDFVAKRDNMPILIKDSDFTESMFATVKDSSSSVNLLIGSKKFIEGWDCWRVSTMGLMHVGKTEGTQIIQLFGRGVRLKGFEWSLKRSGHTKATTKPRFIEEIETLNVFGIESDFMEKFRKYLASEGLPGNERMESIPIPINVTYDFGKKLKIIRPKKINGKEYDFMNDGPTVLLDSVPEYLQKNKIVSNWFPRIQTIASQKRTQQDQKQAVILQDEQLSLLNYNDLYFDLERFRCEKKWYNLSITSQCLIDLLHNASWYELYLPDYILHPESYEEIFTLQKVATELLKRYMDKLQKYRNREFLEPRLEIRELTSEDDNLPNVAEYQVIVDGDASNVIEAIKNLQNDISDNKDVIRVGELDVCNFGKHLFKPLLHTRNSGRITVLPVSLNQSEYQFVLDLKSWCEENKRIMQTQSMELFLLRNLSRGKGVGFFEAGNFHPDFILWILHGTKQYIHFIEPHGLMHEGVNSEKIQFHKRIKEIERRLGDKDIVLNSWIVSWTGKMELQLRGYEPGEYISNNVVFMDEKTYINQIMNM